MYYMKCEWSYNKFINVPISLRLEFSFVFSKIECVLSTSCPFFFFVSHKIHNTPSFIFFYMPSASLVLQTLK